MNPIVGVYSDSYPDQRMILNKVPELQYVQIENRRENIGRAQKQLAEYNAARQGEIAAEEMQVDRLTDNLSRYLVELLPHLQSEDHISVLNQYYKLSTEFERLGDQAVNIADIAAKLSENNTDFSDDTITIILSLIIREEKP